MSTKVLPVREASPGGQPLNIFTLKTSKSKMVKALVHVALLWTVNIATCANGSPTHGGHRGLPGDLHGRTPPPALSRCCVWRGSFPTCSLRLRGGEDDDGADEGVQIFRTVHGYDLEPVPSFSLRTPDQDHGVVCAQHTRGAD